MKSSISASSYTTLKSPDPTRGFPSPVSTPSGSRYTADSAKSVVMTEPLPVPGVDVAGSTRSAVMFTPA